MAKGKSANIFVWIILGLLIIGLAGFGFENFGGSIRSIGSVGDREIGVDEYGRALQQEMRAQGSERGTAMNWPEFEATGLDRQVRGQLVTIAALENEADRLRLSVGDEVVAQEITGIPAFRGPSGSFDRETYRFAIEAQGYDETTFETEVRDELARTLLQAAVLGGVEAPETMIETLFTHIAQRRTIDVVTLTPDTLAEPVDTPDEGTLRAFYDANLDDFTQPEARQITYAWVTPSMLIDTVEVDEDALRALYEERIDTFVQPERRLVERLVFSSDAAAQEAADRIAAGAEFDDIVAERDLSLEDIDLGDVTRTRLGAAGEAVFALDGPGVVGPLPSPLGPALFRMNGILSAQEVPFETAALDLRDELAADRARRVVADARETVLDLVAGGVTMEELADETLLELGQIEWRPGDTEGIAGYAEFREAAAAISPDDFAELAELEDGGLFVLRLDAIVPASPSPFDEVRDAVETAWRAAETRTRLTEAAEAMRESGSLPQPDASAEDTTPPDPDAFPVALDPATQGPVADRIEAITRNDFLPDLPRAIVAQTFSLDEGEIAIVPGVGPEVHLVQLVAVLPPDADNTQIAQLRMLLDQQTTQAIAQDLFGYFVVSLQQAAGVRINDGAVQAVHNQFR